MTPADIKICKKISITNLEIQAWIWLGLPMLLFLYGWMRRWIFLPLGILLVFSIIKIIRQNCRPAPNNDKPPHDNDRPGHGIITRTHDISQWRDISVARSYKVSLILLFLFLMLIGMGGFFPQHYDCTWRNAVFFDLVRHDWPVVYDAPDMRIMCYYFAYWLPASLVGKATGGYIMPGDVALLLWGFWGMSIGFSFVVSFLGGKTKWWHLPLLLTFGFSDRLIYSLFADKIALLLSIDDPYLLYSNYLSFPLASQLKMIFNQTIPLWIALPMLWRIRNNPGHMLLLCSLLFLLSPIACVGISTAVVYWLLKNIKQTMTIENLAGLLILTVTGLFYISNNNAAATQPSRIIDRQQILALGLGFYILSVGVNVPFVWNVVRRDPTFFIMAVTCFLLPFITLGDSDDLGRRATMTLTIMLTYATIDQISKFQSLTKWKKIALPIVMLFGMTDSINVIYSIPIDIADYIENNKYPKILYMMGSLDNREMNYHYNNFISDGETFYTKHLMKQ